MMKQFRGRNLAHPGCLIGVTAGLIIGIILAGVLAGAFNVALNTDLLIWLGFTVGLGLIGWIIGDRLSSRFPALEEDEEVVSSESVDVPHSHN
jgi:hypothetical protein